MKEASRRGDGTLFAHKGRYAPMLKNMMHGRPAFLIFGLMLGLAVGLNLKGLWPQVPLHATATHGQENFAIATGSVDGQTEAVFFLDCLTGDLRAAVLQPRTGKFNALFSYNVLADFGGIGKAPKFLMVTGALNVPQRTGNVQMARSVVYVAEATSGQVACYGIPWNNARQAQMVAQGGTFVPLDKCKMRNVAIRD